MKEHAVRIGTALAALFGLGGIIALVVFHDSAALAGLLVTAGWGIAAVVAVHIVALSASAVAWRALIVKIWSGSGAVFMWARLVRESANALLPVTQIGGDVIGVRILALHKAPAGLAAASVLVDLTLEFLTQIVFTALGLVLLLLHGGGAAVPFVLIGLALAIPAAAGFVLAQRWGMFRLLERFLERMANRFGWSALGKLGDLHGTIAALYRDRRGLALGTLWHLVSWMLGAVEVWLALHFLGTNADFGTALIMESLGQAIRTAAFIVPGGFGVQEGGFLMLATMFGLTPEIGLSVSLVKRMREISLGVPALLGWHAVESRRLLRGSGGNGTGP